MGVQWRTCNRVLDRDRAAFRRSRAIDQTPRIPTNYPATTRFLVIKHLCRGRSGSGILKTGALEFFKYIRPRAIHSVTTPQDQFSCLGGPDRRQQPALP